jgi:hypothetical protein
MSEEPIVPTEVPDGELWVLEGTLDLPVFFQPPPSAGGRTVQGLFLDFSDGTGDGLIQLRAQDPKRINESVWWSREERVAFAFRASVRAPSIPLAWRRSADFLEHMLDRLTFVAGVHTELLSAGMLYNETQVEQCRLGQRTEFDCTTHGVACRKTQPLANPQVVQHLRPSERAKRAMRWFRKGLSWDNVEDRFLSFYFALECISNDIKTTETTTHVCQRCGQPTGIPRSQTDGIKALIARHPELPKNTFRDLGRARGRLVHGGDQSVAHMLRTLEPIVRTLAAEGIALSLRVDPASIRILTTHGVEIIPQMTALFDSAADPATPWSRSVTALLAEIRASMSGAQQADAADEAR